MSAPYFSHLPKDAGMISMTAKVIEEYCGMFLVSSGASLRMKGSLIVSIIPLLSD